MVVQRTENHDCNIWRANKHVQKLVSLRMRTFYIHTSSHSIPVANTILSSSRINLPVLYHLHPYSCICKCNKMTSQSSISPASTYTFVASTFDSFTIRRPARCTSTRIVSGELTVRAVGPSNGRMKSQTHSGVWR